MRDSKYAGILFVGDPHLASRVPGFRKDDYPRAILKKLKWSLDYAKENRLLPVLLGDVFHYPRDNANWLLVEALDLFGSSEVYAVAGNHDCNENTLSEDDTLSVLAAAGVIRLLEKRGPWKGVMNGANVVVGGTCWGGEIPTAYADSRGLFNDALVFWVTHHDVGFVGYESEKRLMPVEIPGIDVVINGHIHRPMEDAVCGQTTWLNPGNISRVNRSDGNRSRKPAVLRVDIANGKWTRQIVEVPHEMFENVFHAEVEAEELVTGESAFIKGLEELQRLKTEGGAGLMVFLDRNLDQFEAPVAEEIRRLAREVMDGWQIH